MGSEESSTDISNYYESICYANAVKEDKNEKVGLVVKRSPAWDTLYISGIKETGKFADSKLKIGMVILTINGMKCPKTVKEIQKVMKETEGGLTIMAATISKEITIVGSNANSPAHSPVRSSTQVATSATCRPEMKDDTSSDSLMTASTEPQTVDHSDHHPSENLETTQSGHQKSSPDDASHPVSPPYSPGSSPLSYQERKMTDSGQRDSPVNISSIDHTGNIIVTPKESPNESTKNSVSSKEFPDDIKVPDLDLSASGTSENEQKDNQHDSLQNEEEAPMENAVMGEQDTEPLASPTSAPAKLSKKQQQQEDDKAKKRGGRSPRLAPGVSPGAFHVVSEQRANKAQRNRTRPGAQRVAGLNTRISEPVIPGPPMSMLQTVTSAPASLARTQPENMPPPHPDIPPRPGARRIGGHRGQDSPYNSGVPSIDGDSSKDGFSEDSFDDAFSRGSIEVSEAPEMSVITTDDLVIAAEVQENPDIVKERIRKQLMLETAKASVVMVERGGAVSDGVLQDEERELHRHKNVKEKLFGGGGKGRDISHELSVNPDQYIRKREYLPWIVKRNSTTNMWIASVVTDQKAYDEGNKAGQERSTAVFSASTEREAHETGLAMATPYLQPIKDHPICVMCGSKFAVFNRPHNCRNCGVVVCSKCTVIWSSKRFPSTYQTSKSTHSVCLACDWSAENFQDAVLKGNLQLARNICKSGNVNLRSPYISSKKKSGQEIMYPIHMAILSGNVDLARWLCKARFVPVTTEVKSRGALKSLPIGTSKGRTPLKLAIKQKNHDMLKFLVAEMEVSLYDEDIKADLRWILAHLSNTLHRAPYEYEIAKRNQKTSTSSSLASSSRSTKPPPSIEARVAYAGPSSGSMTVGTHQSQGSSIADSRVEC